MGTGRTLNKKPRTRPVKNEGEKRRRQKTQRERLIGLGMDADDVAKLMPNELRTLVQQPAQVKKMVAAQQEATAEIAGA